MSGKDFILDFDIVDQENAKQKLKKNLQNKNKPNFFDRVKNIVKNDKGYDDDEFEDDDDGGISDRNDSIADDDIPDGGLADDGLADGGLADDGLSDDGLADDGLADDGLADNKNEGKTIKPMSTKAHYDELKKTAKNKRGVLSALKDYVDKRTRKRVPSPKMLDDDNVSRKDPDIPTELDAPVGGPTSPRAAMVEKNMEALNKKNVNRKRGKTRRHGMDSKKKYAEVLRPLSTPLGNVGIPQAGSAEERQRLVDELLNPPPPPQQSAEQSQEEEEKDPSESELIGVNEDESIYQQQPQRRVFPDGDRKYAIRKINDPLKGGKKRTKKRTKKASKR